MFRLICAALAVLLPIACAAHDRNPEPKPQPKPDTVFVKSGSNSDKKVLAGVLVGVAAGVAFCRANRDICFEVKAKASETGAAIPMLGVTVPVR